MKTMKLTDLLALKVLTQEEVGEMFGVSGVSISRMKDKHPDTKVVVEKMIEPSGCYCLRFVKLEHSAVKTYEAVNTNSSVQPGD